MRRWKSILGLCLGLSLIANIPAYAVTVGIPPSGQSNASSGQESTASQGPTAGNTGGSNSSQPGNNAGPTGGGTTAGPSDGSGITAVTTAKELQVQAQGAALYNATTGTMLYGKSADTKFYPASITKIMTALLVLENCNLDDTVTFRASAVNNLEAGSVTLNLTEGDQLTVRQCLYALMLKSANEVANGLAEHVSGSVSAFAEKMNARAKSLGCTNTNFANPNGLNNSNHYTTPHDMALIAAEAFRNGNLSKIASTVSYLIPATKKAGARTVTMGHKMINPSSSQYYPGIVGGKTGYTSLAGNTLVTVAERDGVRLVAVVMKSKSTHYDDTKAMLDYGFANGGKAPQGGNQWGQDASGWYFTKQDNSKAQNQWMNIDGVDYWFDSNTYMATGWRQFSNGAWYYFKPSGAMAKNYWMQDNGAWFYLGSDGVLLKNGTTPDGFQVDGNGRWIQ